MKVSFFTAVDYGDSPKTTFQFFLEKTDSYFYLGGRKARVIPLEFNGTSQGIEWISESPSILITSFKIASYFSVVLPLIMLITKAVLRSRQNFYEISPKNYSSTSVLNNSRTQLESALALINAPVDSTFSQPLLDLDEFISLCAPHQQAMIYGTAACGYMEISTWLENQQSQGYFKDVFNCFLGQQECEKEEDYVSLQHKTSDKRMIKRINHGGEFLSKCECKAGLVNMIIENVKRKRSGIPIVPVVFVVEKDTLKLDVASIVNKKSPLSKGFTNSEIRRAYKLCFDSKLSEEIRIIAKESFLFISLATNKVSNSAKFKITIRPAPWESIELQTHWENRTRSIHSSHKPYPWREELQKHL